MSEIKHAAEAGHWYKLDGTPYYTIIGKNGCERTVTLADAKKLKDIVPSVTTILKECHKPGLENYKINQNILAALTLPRIASEKEIDWIKRVRQDAREHAKQRAESGTAIHAAIQAGFEKKPSQSYEYYLVAAKEIAKEIRDQEWICEQSFATERYGGKVDLHNQNYLIDIKTKENGLGDVRLYDEHYMQLAGYRHGLSRHTGGINIPDCTCGILFVSEKREAKLLLAKDEDMERGRYMFSSLLNYWYAKTGLEVSGE